MCVGFTCPVDARNGTHSTVLPRAVDLGADLTVGAQVTRVSATGDVEVAAGGASRVVRAGRVVLAGGAVETARLLQLSGLGNDWVGDCLQGHSSTQSRSACSTSRSTTDSDQARPSLPGASLIGMTASSAVACSGTTSSGSPSCTTS
jgi:hypothetical protein